MNMGHIYVGTVHEHDIVLPLRRRFGVNYLIGGSSRCGKSTLARRVRSATEAQAVSGDAFRDALRKTMSFEVISELRYPRAEKIKDEDAFVSHHTVGAAEEVTRKRAQASLVWSFIENYLFTVNRESDDNVVVESIDVWPDLISLSGLRHRAVFLIDTSPRQWERIVATRGKDPRDWMHANQYSDRRIQAWSSFNVLRSETIRSMCEIHQYPYVDLANLGFEEAQHVALEQLLNQPQHGESGIIS